jgi:hypothetical protein
VDRLRLGWGLVAGRSCGGGTLGLRPCVPSGVNAKNLADHVFHLGDTGRLQVSFRELKDYFRLVRYMAVRTVAGLTFKNNERNFFFRPTHVVHPVIHLSDGVSLEPLGIVVLAGYRLPSGGQHEKATKYLSCSLSD